MHILTHQIAWNSICKHVDDRGAFLVRGESKLARSIHLALEVRVMSNHSLSDTVEHMPCHTKTATEFIRLEERGVRKVIGIEQGVASLPVVVHVGSMASESPPIPRKLPFNVVVNDQCSHHKIFII